MGRRAHGLGRIEVANLPMVGWTTMLMGDLAATRTIAGEARDSAERVGNARAAMIAHNTFAHLGIEEGNVEEAVTSAGRIVEISEALGALRFKAYGLNEKAQAYLLKGDRDMAMEIAQEASGIAEAASVAFTGAWIQSTIARLTPDRDAALAALARGKEILAAGAVSHNHIFFRREAIEVCLGFGEVSEAARHIAAWEAYHEGETTPWTDFFIGRARVRIAALTDGPSESLDREIDRLVSVAAEIGFAQYTEALEAART